MTKSKVISLFLFCFLLFICVGSVCVSANVKDSLEHEINENNQKIGTIEEEISKVEDEMIVLDDELSKIKNEINQRNAVIDTYQKSVDEHQRSIDEKGNIVKNVLAQIEETDFKISQFNEELSSTEAYLEELEQVLARRLREFYKYGQSNSLTLDLVIVMFLDGDKNINEILDTAVGISKIAQSDKKLVEEIKQLRDKLKRDRDSLEQESKKLEIYKQDLESEIYNIRELQDKLLREKAALENELNAVRLLEDDYEAKYNALDENVRKNRNELVAIQQDNERLQRQLEDYMESINNYGLVGGANDVSPSGYLRPSTGPITSNYGWRVHPIRGTRSMHTGTDFGGRTGDALFATRGGEIVFSGWYDNVYGRVVIINHGNGFQSFYAHMSRSYVSKGDIVNQGEVIGTMGSTGLSTGSHLHYEIRRNGKSLNPMNYLR